MDILQSIGKPVTETTILGCIFAGVVVGVIYWSKIRVSFFNGFLFNLAFFTLMYIARRYLDGVNIAGGYIGLMLLYALFLCSALLTKIIIAKIRSG